jgi:uracil-DNA glycosylase
LQNIFKELQTDIPGFDFPSHGDLTYWADQGVLLLNATLTVEASKPGSHQKKGWEIFTDQVISELSSQRTGLIFLLWGKYAQAKEALIDNSKHYILKAAHPSPFSAHAGFFGCKHFSKANEYLKRMGQREIDWQV